MTITTEYASRFRRATPNSPCPICKNMDWCSIAADGSFVICMKDSSGAMRETANGGWLHRLTDRPQTIRRPGIRSTLVMIQRQTDDFTSLATKYASAVMPAMLDKLGATLGISSASLSRLNAGWSFDLARRRGDRHQPFDAGDALLSCDNRAWIFPMSDALGRITGLRVRMESGEKFSAPGGREGLFIPAGLNITGGRLLVAEGPTDTAALLDLEFSAVGRPSCTGGATLLAQLVKRHRPSELVIVSDGDVPGRRGAESLACVMLPFVPSIRVIEPPAGIKDPRAWKAAGATTDDINRAIDAAPARKITVRAKGAVNA